MSPAEMVVVCALGLLGRSPEQLPPIKYLDVRPPYVSATAEAFVHPGSQTIHLITTTPAFREASSKRPIRLCDARAALVKIASILVHEEWHVRHGADERKAYEAQLTALTMLGAGPGSPIYSNVKRAMAQAIAARPDRPVYRTAGR